MQNKYNLNEDKSKSVLNNCLRLLEDHLIYSKVCL